MEAEGEMDGGRRVQGKDGERKRKERQREIEGKARGMSKQRWCCVLL